MSDFINRTSDPRSNEYLLHFVAKWLENRTVEFEKTSVVMLCGLVQGSPVSPPIFVIFLSYSTSSKNSVILIYCDDVTLISWAATGEELAKEVKTEVGKFENWLGAHEMEFAASKSKIMLFNRSLKTAETVFKNVDIEKVVGMRVLGLWVTASLCFHEHVNRVLNSLRKRTIVLRMFKKLGLSVNHALQFSLCVANAATYGLWWHCFLSKSDWKRLEAMWSRFLKISAHERCPKAAKPDKVRELLGIRSFRSFSDYLIHLRTASHHLKPRCERFTLAPSELEEYNSLQAPPMVPSMARGCTREQSNQRRFDAEKHKLRKKLGTVKAYTIMLSKRHEWNEDSFKLEKDELRKNYKIDRKKSCNVEIPKLVMLDYLNSITHPKARRPNLS